MREPFLNERMQFFRETQRGNNEEISISFFSRFNQYESKHEQPLYNFSYAEMRKCIISLIQTGSMATSGSLDTQKSILSNNIEWAKRKKELDTSRSLYNMK